MPTYPDRKYVADVFALFFDPPEGTKKFFEYVDDNVHWQVTGQHRFSGTWTTKEDYYNATWANINLLLQPPGYKLTCPTIVVDAETGWSVIEMKTVGVTTKGGVPYDQHYSWHCRWNTDGKIVEAKAFLDADHLEKVLGGEQRRQGIATK
ncbi:putative ketosteroid isomerase [Rosellinia necatrix]|uniref:Putative ketosteroid isomerase n=1 Tax=Rosellinia necatrix TaxID=77044 RepID=A0A1S7UIC9_ROSNE|nr:putative ketosteroid isomerase [Rosellinia necatrix]